MVITNWPDVKRNRGQGLADPLSDRMIVDRSITWRREEKKGRSGASHPVNRGFPAQIHNEVSAEATPRRGTVASEGLLALELALYVIQPTCIDYLTGFPTPREAKDARFIVRQ